MSLKANATLIFTAYRMALAGEPDGVYLTFTSPDPGPGEESDVVILLTDTDLAAVTTQVQLRDLIQNKLNRRVRAAGIASKLDPFIGQSLTVA